MLHMLNRALLSCVVASVGLSTAGPTALADDYLDRANRLVRLIPGNSSTEAVLFPAIAGMESAPGSIPGELGQFRLMALIGPGHPAWPRVSAWAAGEAQQEVLAKLGEVTEDDFRGMVTLKYGRENVPSEWAEAGLFVELGPEGLLAPLDPLYLDELKRVHALVMWEAVRLAEEGDADAGLEHYRDLLFLYRQLMDRPSRAEKLAAYRLMAIALEHVRDFAFQYRGSDALTADGLTTFVGDIGERQVRALRTNIPRIPEVLGDQMLDRLYEREGDVKVDEFALTMARVRSAEEPLELFNAVAYYRQLAALQDDWYDVAERIETVLGDITARWDYDLNDPFLVTVPTDYSQTNLTAQAIVGVVAGDMEKLIPYKRALQVHLSGTRLALGCAAYMIDFDGEVPPNLIAIQPNYVDSLTRNLDLFGYDYDELESEEFVFFEPRRETAVLRGGGGRLTSGDMSPTELRELRRLDRPHPMEIFFPADYVEMPGGQPRDSIDFTKLYEEVEGNVAVGPTAQFEFNWNSGIDEDDRNRVDRSIVGQAAPPFRFYDSFARELDAADRKGEILVVMPGTATGPEGRYGAYLDIFQRIGRDYAFDGVRLAIRAGDFAEENMSEQERQLMAANYARQAPVNFYFPDEEDLDFGRDSPWVIGLDDDDQDAFIIDRNGVVRAAGSEVRFIGDALDEWLKEQPVEALLYAGREAEIARRAEARSVVSAPSFFETSVDLGEFVLYSRGINRRDDNPPGVDEPQRVDYSGRELLFWPPVLSLQRAEKD